MREIRLQPEKATPGAMRRLEEMNLIRRLAPRDPGPAPAPETTHVERIYTGDARFGRHCLICVTVAASTFKYFGAHSDNEDIFFIGRGDCKPLYLAIALRDQATLERKAGEGTLSAADFICLEAEFNHPETSFFTVNKNVFHGECVAGSAAGHWPSFYVAEPSDLDLVSPDLGQFLLRVDS